MSHDEVAFSDDSVSPRRVAARVTVFVDVGQGHVVFDVPGGAPTSA